MDNKGSQSILEVGNYLVKLLECALQNEKPEEKPQNISFNEIFQMAKRHCVENMAFYSIERLDNKPEYELYKSWQMARDSNLVKSIVQKEEQKNLITNLMNGGINVVPLKGSILNSIYPQEDYRQMADIDILFDKTKDTQAKEIMEKMNYLTKNFKNSNHDNYEKKPYLGVELHRELMSDCYAYASYFYDIWDKVVQDSKNKRLFHMSWESFYIFMIAHHAKHYYSCGSGIRSIMDIYVFCNEFKDKLDEKFIQQELQKLDLWEFKQKVDQVICIWFQKGESNNELNQMIKYIFNSGVYGTKQNFIVNRISELDTTKQNLRFAKLSYCFERLFLPYKSMCHSYPQLKYLVILLPFCWIHRIVKVLVFSPKKIKMEIRVVRRIE